MSVHISISQVLVEPMADRPMSAIHNRTFQVKIVAKLKLNVLAL